MNISQRMKSPTPPFFKKVRNTGLVLAGLAASILGAPVALPAIVLKVASYLAVAGGVASTVSQAATQPQQPKVVATRKKATKAKKADGTPA